MDNGSTTTSFEEQFSYVIRHERSLNKQLKDVSIPELHLLQEKLGKIIINRQEKEKEERAAAEAKREKILEVRKMMSELGLSEEDITDMEQVNGTAPELKKVPKYLYIDDEQREHRWSGRGKPPKIFQELLEKGVNLDEDCLARLIEK